MASSKTLAIRAPKRTPRLVSHGPVAEVFYWGDPTAKTVSIRRSEFRRYSRDARVCAIVPIHIEDPTTGIREYDLRPKPNMTSTTVGAA